jgi:hypothetical protein
VRCVVRISVMVPSFCSPLSLTLTSHANVPPRSVFQADFRRQSSSLAPVERVFFDRHVSSIRSS